MYNFFLLFLVENGFTQSDMALMLGVSKRTVENRMAEFHLTNQNRFSDIDDGSLDVHTQHIIGIFPRSGNESHNEVLIKRYRVSKAFDLKVIVPPKLALPSACFSLISNVAWHLTCNSLFLQVSRQ